MILMHYQALFSPEIPHIPYATNKVPRLSALFVLEKNVLSYRGEAAILVM